MIISPGWFCLYYANYMKTEFSLDNLKTCTGGINPYMDCDTLMNPLPPFAESWEFFPWHQRIVY
jgi:hypothetical protein